MDIYELVKDKRMKTYVVNKLKEGEKPIMPIPILVYNDTGAVCKVTITFEDVDGNLRGYDYAYNTQDLINGINALYETLTKQGYSKTKNIVFALNNVSFMNIIMNGVVDDYIHNIVLTFAQIDLKGFHLKYHYLEGNIFDYENTHMIVHCISSDIKMGAGIAKEINSRYDIKNKIFKKYFNSDNPMIFKIPSIVPIENVINLVTKENYWNKPTYKTLQGSLNILYQYCEVNNIKKIVMPKIGCGLDKLNWEKVQDMIINTFSPLDMEIIVCRLREEN